MPEPPGSGQASQERSGWGFPYRARDGSPRECWQKNTGTLFEKVDAYERDVAGRTRYRAGLIAGGIPGDPFASSPKTAGEAKEDMLWPRT